MAHTSAQLASEINLDPKALGYAPHVTSGNDSAIASILNSTYAGVAVVYRSNLLPQEVLKSLVWAELSTKTAVQIAIIQLLLAPNFIDAGQVTIRDIFVGIFPTGATINNLNAISKVVNPTRAEELWGAPTKITATEVAIALRG